MIYQSRTRVPNDLQHRQDIQTRVLYEVIFNLIREIPEEKLKKIFNVEILEGTQEALRKTTDEQTQERIYHLIREKSTEYSAKVNLPD